MASRSSLENLSQQAPALMQVPNSPTHSLTQDPDYLPFRFTLPHDIGRPWIDTLLTKIGASAMVALEYSDKHKEHFHIVALTPTDSVYKAIQNGLDRCKLETGLHKWKPAQRWSKRNYGTYVGALRYTMKDGNYHLIGSGITPEFLSTIPPWTKCAKTAASTKPERLSDPVLTLSNVIKQAVKFRAQHYLATTDLAVVIQNMLARGWIPSRDILRGIPAEHHDLFRARVDPKFKIHLPIWAGPHSNPYPWTSINIYAPPTGGGMTYRDYKSK